MKASADETACRQALSHSSTQVSMTLEKPASLPPIEMLTRVVPAFSAASWPLRTSEVLAPLQATETKDAGS